MKLKHHSHNCLFSFGLGSNLDSPFHLAFWVCSSRASASSSHFMSPSFEPPRRSCRAHEGQVIPKWLVISSPHFTPTSVLGLDNSCSGQLKNKLHTCGVERTLHSSFPGLWAYSHSLMGLSVARPSNNEDRLWFVCGDDCVASAFRQDRSCWICTHTYPLSKEPPHLMSF